MSGSDQKIKWNHSTRAGLHALFWFLMLGVPNILEEEGLLRDGFWAFGSWILYTISTIMLWFLASRHGHWAAIDRHTEDIEYNPADIDAYLKRGHEYEFLNKKKALKDYSTATRIAPNDPRGFSRRAELYRDLGQDENALADYNQAIRLDPRSGGTEGSFIGGRSIDWFYADRGNIHMRLNNYEEAIADFTAANQAFVENNSSQQRKYAYEYENDRTKYLWQRAAAYRAAGDPSKAIQDFEFILAATDQSKDRQIARVREQIAESYRELAQSTSDPDLSLEALETANEQCALARRHQQLADSSAKYEHSLNSVDLSILDTIRATRLRYEDLSGKIAELTKMIAADQDHPDAYRDRGDVYRIAGKHAEALSDYTRALSFHTKEPWDKNHSLGELGLQLGLLFTHFRRGDLYCQRGDYYKAIADFTSALNLKPVDGPMRLLFLLRGDAYLRLGEEHQAMQDYMTALKSNQETAAHFVKHRKVELKSQPKETYFARQRF